jgi:hypothetical protein
MANNPLIDLFGENVRRVMYGVWSGVVLVVSVLQFVYTSGGRTTPDWLDITTGVVGIVGSFLGVTAAANTRDKGTGK